MKISAYLARRSGKVWTHADFLSPDINFENIDPMSNVLIIGPIHRALEPALINAPKALKLALRDRAIPNLNASALSEILRFASNDEKAALKASIQSGSNFDTKYARMAGLIALYDEPNTCLLYTSPSPRDQRGSRMPSSA